MNYRLLCFFALWCICTGKISWAQDFGSAPAAATPQSNLGDNESVSYNESISYNDAIRPILSDRCFSCHGPDPSSREAGLRLDQADGDEGSHAYAIEPGSAETSEVWARVISEDDSDRMPPPDAHKPSLSKEELQLLKQWIDQGAKYDKFWAFEKPIKPDTSNIAPLVIAGQSWSDQPIDLLVARKLAERGLQPSAHADLRLLLRRVTLDLTGLPPSREELHAFLSRCESDGLDVAYEARVDELLQRPQYGEHMARYWLDLVRFADTNGMHKDFYRNHVLYRDWVIRAFNENLPYDDFTRYQLAGDLFENPTDDQLVASGFHRLHLIIDRGTALPEESFTKNVLDRVTAVSTAFLGMTAQCAQCHDHKYDPISQKEFYSLYAFFNNLDAAPETVNRPKFGLQEPFISLGTDEQLADLQRLGGQIEPLSQQIGELKSEIARLKKEASVAREEAAKTAELKTGDAKTTTDESSATDEPFDFNANTDAVTELQTQLEALTAKLKPIKAEFDALDAAIPRAMVMKERSEVRTTNVLVRGQYDAPGEEVQRGTPSFLPPLNPQGDVATRMDFANWLVAPEHPLTARVAVNRFWQQFFGVGIVKTAEDFGAQGEVPSNQLLLDHLAVSFVESGWDIKHMVKQIVMSKTYRQSSRATPEQFKADPENRWLARGSRYRLDAEVIRDQILTSSGLLSDQMYGPSVKPPQPPGLWQAVTMIGERYQPDEGDAIFRRSIYTFWKRAMPPPQMTILNAPIRDACIARRERTNTPAQALLLLNEPEYLKAAGALAAQVLQQEPQHRIEFAWETITARLPDERERETLKSLLAELQVKYENDPALADELYNEVNRVKVTLDKRVGQNSGQANGDSSLSNHAELAAWTIAINAIYNLDITKTQE